MPTCQECACCNGGRRFCDSNNNCVDGCMPGIMARDAQMRVYKIARAVLMTMNVQSVDLVFIPKDVVCHVG
jgi:hypothetical protein